MITDFQNFQQELNHLKYSYIDSIDLPQFSNLENIFADGANVYEGYQRGWGLEFSKDSQHFANIVDQIRNDELYKFAFSAAEGLTIVSEERRMNMFIILLKYLRNVERGDLIEFGSYKGGNAIFLAVVSKVLGLESKVFACDSYEGMPLTDKELDLHNEGDFSDVNFEILSDYIKDLGLEDLILVKGFFSETLKSKQMENLSFSFAHIDCDIYSACVDSFNYLKNRMVSKGYLVFDDATVSSCIGATRFVEKEIIRNANLNSEQVWPHFVFRWAPQGV